MKEYEETIITKDKETGEIIGTKIVEINPGETVLVKVIPENPNEFCENKKELDKQIKNFIEKNEGAFISLIYKYNATIFKELEEKAPGSKCTLHIIRFMMLATRLTFGGKLLDKNGHRVKKSTLMKIWDTSSRNSRNETYDLLKECGYVYETEEGYIMINEDMVIKGAITDIIKELKKEDKDFTCVRVFVKNLEEMFNNTEPKQRKQLANLFKILPYINFKYNVFCANPTETEEENLKPLNWTELTKLCGYDESQVTRFKKSLMTLKVFGSSVIGQFESETTGKIIIVNPKIYYGGDDVKDVEYLYGLFKMKPKKN